MYAKLKIEWRVTPDGKSFAVFVGGRLCAILGTADEARRLAERMQRLFALRAGGAV